MAHWLPDGQKEATGWVGGGENERVGKEGRKKETQRAREECFKTKISLASFDWQARKRSRVFLLYAHTRTKHGLLHPPSSFGTYSLAIY